jgi:hypothetical protein
MRTLTSIGTNNNSTDSIFHNQMAAAVRNVEELISASSQKPQSFQYYEKTLLQVLNELGRQVLQRKFEETSRRYNSEYILADGVRYKRFSKGTVEYHSLCGSIPVERYTYRQAGVRNGLTVVPLELEEQLMARTTPALAY